MILKLPNVTKSLQRALEELERALLCLFIFRASRLGIIGLALLTEHKETNALTVIHKPKVASGIIFLEVLDAL